MPMKPMHPCKHIGCDELTRETYCTTHKPCAQENRENSNKRGYTYKWRVQSKRFLDEHPWCTECARVGNAVIAEEVDHITPHRGNAALFWDKRNWQGLCKAHHSIKTAKEDGGFGNRRKKV